MQTKKSRKDLTKETLAFYWRHAWSYPRYVVGLGFAIPFTVLVNNILPPIILANVLNKLSRHEFLDHHV